MFGVVQQHRIVLARGARVRGAIATGPSTEEQVTIDLETPETLRQWLRAVGVTFCGALFAGFLIIPRHPHLSPPVVFVH
jgi:hypothetical protein